MKVKNLIKQLQDIDREDLEIEVAFDHRLYPIDLAGAILYSKEAEDELGCGIFDDEIPGDSVKLPADTVAKVVVFI